jgi:tetratricopeptide (TPR) repeat protein
MRAKSAETEQYGGGHPTAAQLEDHLAHKWPAAEERAFNAHLNACIVCRRRLRRARGLADDPEPPVGTADYPHVWTLEDPRVRRMFITALLKLGRDLVQLGSLDAALDNLYVAVEQARQLPDGEDPQVAAYFRFTSLCEVAYVHRELNELDEAEEALCAAREHLDQTSGYAGFEGRWHEVAGTLFRDQCRFDEAIEAFRIAEAHYLEVDYKHRAGCCRLHLGTVYLTLGKPRRAVKAMTSAHGLLDLTDRRFALIVFHNTLYALTEAGALDGLDHYLRNSLPAYREYGTPLWRIRRLGLLAKVAAGEGRYRQAERLFRHNVAGLQEAGQLYDAALAALELATLLARQGRPSAEVLALLDGAVAAFVERYIYREVAMSFQLLCDTFRLEQGTAEAIARFARELRAEARRPEEAL